MNRRYQLDIVVRGLDRASGPLGRIHGALSRIAHVATGVIVAHGLFGIAAGIRTIADNALDAYTDLELMEVSTANLIARELARAERLRRAAEATDEQTIAVYNLKDALEEAAPMAEGLTKWVEELGIRTPFEEEDILTSFRIAAAYGFTTIHARELATEQERIAAAQEDKVVSAQRLTKALTDVIAGSGLPPEYVKSITIALGQVQAKGKLAAQEIHQLVNAGIGIDLMADSMNMTVGEFKALQEEGGVLANEFIPALVTLFERDFGGAAERIMNTLGGVLLSLKTIGRVLLRDFFGPSFEAATPYLKAWFEELASDENRAKAKEAGIKLRDDIIAGFAVGVKIIEAIQKAWDAALDAGSFVLRAPLEIVKVFLSDEAKEDLEEIEKSMYGGDFGFEAGNEQAISGGMQGMMLALIAPTLLKGLGGLLSLLSRINVVGRLVVLGAGLIGAAWKGNFGGVQEAVDAFLKDSFIPFAEEVKRKFYDDILPPLREWAGDMWNVVKDSDTWDAAIATLSGAWDTFAQAVIDAMDDAGGALEDFNLYLEGDGKDAWDDYRGEVDETLLSVEEFGAGIVIMGVKALVSLNVHLTPFRNYWRKWTLELAPQIQATKDWFALFATEEYQYVKDFFSGVLVLGGTAFETIKNIMKDYIVPDFERFFGLIGDLSTSMNDLATLIIDAVIMPSFTTLWGFFNESVVPVFTAFKDVVEAILLKSLEFVDWLLPDLMEGLALLLSGTVNVAMDVFEKHLEAFELLILLLEDPIKSLGGWLNDVLTKALEGASKWAESLTGWLVDLKEAIDNITFQDPPFVVEPGGGGGGGFGGEPDDYDDGVPPDWKELPKKGDDKPSDPSGPIKVEVTNYFSPGVYDQDDVAVASKKGLYNALEELGLT